MKEEMYIYFDEEGDYLEVNIGNFSECYFNDIEEGISEIMDEKNGKIIGFAILNFKERTKALNDLKISLPNLSKSGEINLYFDEEGDFLEISIGNPAKCYAVEVEPGIFIRKNEKTEEVKSIGILNFKERTKGLNDLKISLPSKIEIC